MLLRMFPQTTVAVVVTVVTVAVARRPLTVERALLASSVDGVPLWRSFDKVELFAKVDDSFSWRYTNTERSNHQIWPSHWLSDAID